MQPRPHSVGTLVAAALVVLGCGDERGPSPAARLEEAIVADAGTGLDAGPPVAAEPDAGAGDEDNGARDAGPEEPDVARSPLARERDRVLATLDGDRCVTWRSLDDDQRAVFLLLTDLLGKRTLLEDGTSALAHVLRMHAVRGRQHVGCVRCCGDREFNRAYLSVDDALLAALRGDALPAWRDSRDLGGPHAPFTASRETSLGQPRGQAQFFAHDDDAVALGRPGVEEVIDAHALELDLDFNLLHESAPTCEYGGERGTERYQTLWREAGQGGDAELGYAPAGC